MDIEFSEAGIRDVEPILEMMQEFNAIDGYPFDEGLRKINLLKFIQSPELGRLWVICHGADVIGYVVLAFSFSFEFKGRDAFIDELYLKPLFRGKGIGGKTLDFVFKEASSLAVKAIHLEVEKHNIKAKRLYSDNGFKDHNRFLMTKFVV